MTKKDIKKMEAAFDSAMRQTQLGTTISDFDVKCKGFDFSVRQEHPRFAGLGLTFNSKRFGLFEPVLIPDRGRSLSQNLETVARKLMKYIDKHENGFEYHLPLTKARKKKSKLIYPLVVSVKDETIATQDVQDYEKLIIDGAVQAKDIKRKGVPLLDMKKVIDYHKDEYILVDNYSDLDKLITKITKGK